MLIRLLLLGLVAAAFALESSELPSPPPIADFLLGLTGDWEGEAYRTPQGRLPYAIRFERTAEGHVSAVANPGGALHHWTFFEEAGALRLRFLTTFGGNDEPIHLVANGSAADAFEFRSGTLEHLRVRIEPHDRMIDVDVSLHGKPHVGIRWARP
ncbi:MAG: hypothetical protein U9Q81_21390 [Pseudomonadota bacterium]|nr:hypothetical protein [Pseudomonadota bacterium]